MLSEEAKEVIVNSYIVESTKNPPQVYTGWVVKQNGRQFRPYCSPAPGVWKEAKGAHKALLRHFKNYYYSAFIYAEKINKAHIQNQPVVTREEVYQNLPATYIVEKLLEKKYFEIVHVENERL